MKLDRDTEVDGKLIWNEVIGPDGRTAMAVHGREEDKIDRTRIDRTWLKREEDIVAHEKKRRVNGSTSEE